MLRSLHYSKQISWRNHSTVFNCHLFCTQHAAISSAWTTQMKRHDFPTKDKLWETAKMTLSNEGASHIEWMLEKNLLLESQLDSVAVWKVLKVFWNAVVKSQNPLHDEQFVEIANTAMRIRDFTNPSLQEFNAMEFLEGAKYGAQHLLNNLESHDGVSIQKIVYPDLFQEIQDEKGKDLQGMSQRIGNANRIQFLKWSFTGRDQALVSMLSNLPTSFTWPEMQCLDPMFVRASAFNLQSLDFNARVAGATHDGTYAVIDVKIPIKWSSEKKEDDLRSSSVFVRYGGWLSDIDPDWKIMDISGSCMSFSPFNICIMCLDE
mmetsp:Transcript_22350/g.28965  ORF Transcript_22350/g.28965 Transcript_22350/m.28965 type:complete len:319 (+) Transcript_22350:167-1123(+)